jgi:hypothetical protein
MGLVHGRPIESPWACFSLGAGTATRPLRPKLPPLRLPHPQTPAPPTHPAPTPQVQEAFTLASISKDATGVKMVNPTNTSATISSLSVGG